MGIVNVTPDSFSDGGSLPGAAEAVAFARALVAQGADIVDVGGESTRPGSDEVDPAEELDRVCPVIEAFAMEGHCVSVDTRHAEVAAAALKAGAAIVNDVSGFRDRAMIEAVAASRCGLVVMHMLGEPKTMQDDPHYDDVVTQVRDYLRMRADELVAAGVSRERIAIDPGIGFGKTLDHNLALIARLGELADLGMPVLVGASRKRMIGVLTGVDEPRLRVGGSVAAAIEAARRGAAILRVHDVRETVQALKVSGAIARAEAPAGE